MAKKKSKNSNMNAAKTNKNDEFYTRIEDVSRELCNYTEHFKDKVVLCNCDDPTWSAFWKYFHLNFKELGLKRLVSTHYDDQNPSYKMVYEGGDDNDCNVGVQTPLDGNGDFANEECVQLLDEADIVVTNPPFSLFRAYVKLLVEHKKKFVILGNMNAGTYKEIFPLIKEGKIWAGKTFNKTLEFIMPDDYQLKGKAFIDANGKKHGFVPAIAWFTNLTLSKRSEKLLLTSTYDPKKYPKYDNYDAIHINKCNEIPKDYQGVMGVPISFLEHHCKEQFEILGITSNDITLGYLQIPNQLKYDRPYLNGERKFAHLLVKRLDLPYNPSNWTNSSYKIPHPTEDDINPEIEAYIRQTIRDILSSNQYQDTGDPNDLFAFMQTYIKTSPASEFDIDELKLYIASERAKFFA